MDWKITTLIVAAAVCIVSAVLGRYELVRVSTGEPVVAYRLDRWTGDVVIMVGGKGVRTEIKDSWP